MKIPVLFTFDDNLIMPASVCITSLLENAAPETFYDIFIIHSAKYAFCDTVLNDFPKYYPNCRITFKPISGEFVGGYEIRQITETCYYRLISPEVITEYDRIIYSDVDVIFREDLTKYYKADIGNAYFGAVSTCPELRKPLQKYLTDTLQFDFSKDYFYSGNLVINLKLLREDGLCQEFRRLAKNKYKMQDMDIINILCRGRFYKMSPSFCLSTQTYNLFVYRKEECLRYYSEEEIEDAINSGIVHYNGAKPWKTWCHHFDIWWKYYRDSLCFNEKFYANFYNAKHEELDQLSLKQRIKILARFFKVGRLIPTEEIYRTRD